MLVAIVSFLKALPAIVSIVDKFIVAWVTWRKNVSDSEHVKKINEAMEALEKYQRINTEYQAAVLNADAVKIRELLFKRRGSFLEMQKIIND